VYLDQPDPVSLATVFVETFFNGEPLRASGTGFVIRTNTAPILVTARHMVTGRHPDGTCLHSEAALPNQLTLTNYFGPLVVEVPLYSGQNDPNTDTPLFWSHEKPLIDVALLPLPQEAGLHAANFLDESLWRPETYTGGIPVLHVADTCHIIGYPEGLTNRIGDNRVLPLWKTGHLATDPHFNFTNKRLGFENDPLCLVDATTRPGLSGAPVFVVSEHGLTAEWASAGAQAADDLARGGRLVRRTIPRTAPFTRCTRLVGVYSGRTSESSDIGLVWSPSVIHQILSKNCTNW
jgi:hypothetical protein